MIEAPRGTLFHHYRVDENDLVTYCNLIVSTTNNNQAMNEAVRAVAAQFFDGREVTEGLLNHIEVAIRAYDPCLSCATHALGADAAGGRARRRRRRARLARRKRLTCGSSSSAGATSRAATTALGPLLLRRIDALRLPDVDDDRGLSVADRARARSRRRRRARCSSTRAAERPRLSPSARSARARRMTHTTHALVAAKRCSTSTRRCAAARRRRRSCSACAASSFELGEGLSDEGAARLEAAWEFLRELMRERSLEAWRRAGAGAEA